ncbi:MAG: chromosomal replication initiator protein DnaA, partial [Clostridia bacterium]|nr:chromosomal replication initiator protein DnaA [Clostridia bacterium]
YNPLFIYGDSGLGKTHLLYAIGNTVREREPSVNIIYIKGDEFTNELITAIQTNKSQEFHDKYRKADLLLVDDIQFIAGRIQTQEEFFNTFNTLYEDNKQIVLTSDRPPKEIHRLEERLQSRFVWGVLADIQPPDYETRMAIIRNKAQQLGIILNNDVAEYIAENVTANVRQLEGVVKKLMAYSELLGDNIDINLVKRTIKEIIKEKGPSPEIIIDMTAQYYSLSSNDIRGKSQSKTITQARKIAMYLIRKLLNTTLDDIGKEFNNRDHSTVVSAVKKIKEMMDKDSSFEAQIDDMVKDMRSIGD